MSKQSTTQEQQARVLARKRREATSQNARPQTAPDQLNADVATLQHTLGNQAVGQMLGGSPIQRQPGEERSLPHDLGQIMNRPVVSAPRKPTIQRAPPAGGAAAPASQGWMASFGSWLSPSNWKQAQDDDEKKGLVGSEAAKTETDLRERPKRGETGFGDQESVDAAENKQKEEDAEIFSVDKITINLYEADIPQGKRPERLKGLDEMKGSIGTQGSSLKAGVEGKKGFGWGMGEAKGGAAAKANTEGLEAESNIELKFGKGGKITTNNPLKMGKGALESETSAQIEGFAGAKGEAKGKAEAKYDKEKGFSAAAGGQASAFVGGSLAGKTEVNIKVAGVDVMKTSGTLGVTYGAGGEAKFNIAWKDGKFSMGGKMSASLGLGFTAGGELEITAPKVINNLASWAGSKIWGAAPAAGAGAAPATGTAPTTP